MVLSKGLHYVTKKRLRIFLLLIMGLAVYKTLISLQSAIPEENLTIVILGGGLTRNGEVPLHTQLRLDLAFQLFNQNMKRPLLITLSGGTPHKPNPLNSMGFPIFEATAAARKLIQMGVPADHVMEENFSLDTVGNAYFLRAVHCEPAHLRELIIITNNWHMERTKAIFDFVFKLPAYNNMERTSLFRHNPYKLLFQAVDSGIKDQHLLQARQEREKQSLDQFLTSTAPTIHSFEQMHQWIFQNHRAYSTARLPNSNSSSEDNRSIPELLLQTY